MNHRILTPISGRLRRGVALITVVTLVALLTITIISFFLLVQDDRKRARSFLDTIRARLMIEGAVQEAMAKIMDGSEVPYTGSGSSRRALAHMSASPGLMEVRQYEQWPNRGYQAGADAFTDTNAFFRNPFKDRYERTAAGDWAPANPRLIPLFSWRSYAPGIRYLKIANNNAVTGETNPAYNPAAQFNLNSIQNPFYPGQLYLSGIPTDSTALKFAIDGGTEPRVGVESTFRFKTGESTFDRPIWVQWIPVYENPNAAPGPTNRIIGRYAYWIDVENTKVNLNTSRRLFEESTPALITGKSDGELGSGSYFIQGNNLSTTNRQAVERKIWTSTSGTSSTKDGVAGDGNNDAAAYYFDLWMGWNDEKSDLENRLPYSADASLVDWRVFTGMRPYGPSGLGATLSVEDLTRAYGANLTTGGGGRFNTWLESYSLLDPQVEISDLTKGELTLATFRRTHAMSTTIYGFEDELDPLGRPKVDIVEFQKKTLGAGNTEYQALFTRLRDTNYHRAYYPNAFPNNGSARSFAQAFNGFAGDLDAGNDNNGRAVINQMLVNIIAYGRRHDEPPATTMGSLASLTNQGVWPAKSMPYVAEVATRARSAAFLLQASDRALTNFYTQNGTNYDRISKSLTGTDGTNRPNFWYLTNVLIDMAVGLVNPNPFATNPFVGTLTLDADGASFWNGITLDPLYPGATTPSTNEPINGVYAARPSPGAGGDPKMGYAGWRATGTNAYFVLGAVPATSLTNSSTNVTTALRVKGWRIMDAGGIVFHRVPMPHLGQSIATVRPWWQMAVTNANSGPRTIITSLVHFTSTNASDTSAFYSMNRSVGWFSDRTIRGFRAGFPTITSADSDFPLVVNTTAFTDTNTGVGGYILPQLFAKSSIAALVERVQCIDPTLGHRTGNPANTVSSSDLRGAGTPLQGHFYGLAGHAWRLYPWTNSASTPFGPIAQTNIVTRYQTNTTTIQVPSGNTFIPKQVSYVVPVGTITNVSFISGVTVSGPPPALTEQFANPFTTRTNQSPMRAPYLVEYGDANDDQAGPIRFNFGGTRGDWAVNVETNGITYNTGLNDLSKGVGGPSSPAGMFCSAPRGEPMTTVGELGFVHSGFIQRPINLTGNQWLKKQNFGGSSPLGLGAPQNGPPMSMLLDLFVPHAFRNSTSGDPVADDQPTWVASGLQNTPSEPRRGTLNVNIGIASDSYLSIREGRPGNDIWYDPNSMPAHPAWVPSAIFYRRSGTDDVESSPASDTAKEPNGGKLDPFLQPTPRYRRGWESVLSMIGGDYTPFRGIGGGAWGGKLNSWDVETTVGYLATGLPLGTWSPGRGVTSDSVNNPFANFDPEYGGSAKLLTLGVERRGSASSSGFFSGLFAADQVSTWVKGSSQLDFRDLVWESKSNLERKGNLWQATRFMLAPIRHFISEVPYDITGQSDIYAYGNLAVPPLSVDSIASALSPAMGMNNHNGYSGGMGLYRNAFMAQAANMISTSANAFTVHVVSQAIKDTGKVRKNSAGQKDVGESGPGYMDMDDQVVAEQWGQIVVARLPRRGSGTDGDVQRYTSGTAPAADLVGAPESDYQILYYRILDNPK